MFDEKTEKLLSEIANKYAMHKYKIDQKIRVQNIVEKAENKFLKTLLVRSYVSDFMSEGKTPDFTSNTAVESAIEKQKNNVLTKPSHVLLTINPKPGVSLKQLVATMVKFLKKKWLKEYFYVYEVRKKGDQPGLHCHIIYRYAARPFDMTKSVKKHFLDICDVNNHQILNFKYLSDDIINDKVNYLLGEKKEKKQSGVAATKIYRTENSLSPYYDSSPLLSCRATAKIQFTVLEPE